MIGSHSMTLKHTTASIVPSNGLLLVSPKQTVMKSVDFMMQPRMETVAYHFCCNLAPDQQSWADPDDKFRPRTHDPQKHSRQTQLL